MVDPGLSRMGPRGCCPSRLRLWGAVALAFVVSCLCGCGPAVPGPSGGQKLVLRSKSTVPLGTFESTGSGLVVSDPVYRLDTARVPGLGAVLANCRTGTWRAEVVMKRFDAAGPPMASELRVVHGGIADAGLLKWEPQKDEIGADTGQVGVYDLAHFHDHSLVPPGIKWTVGGTGPAIPDDLWYSYCCELTCGKREGGTLLHGVVTNSGWGDGGYRYSVARDAEGKVCAIWIVFVDDAGRG